MENSQSHSEMASNEDLWSKGPESCVSDGARLPSKFTLNPDFFETLHKPSVKNECDGLLGLMQTLSRVLVHNALVLFVQKAVAWLD